MVLKVSFRSQSLCGRNITIETVIWCDSEDESLPLPRYESQQLVMVVVEMRGYYSRDVLQEKERSPSPVQPPTTPPLDLSTLHQQVDSAEPLTSRSFRHPQGDDRLVSPRNSIVMTRRVFAPDDSPQPDGPVSQMSKQIHSLKRKLRRYEEGFEKEFGYRPSHADKMSNPDTKKMCSLLTKLRREVKSLKEEGSSALGKVLHSGDNSDTQQVPQSIKEDAIHDVEKVCRLFKCRQSVYLYL
ncbi:Protein fam13a [Homalodisca vitripennis]|nr:Protein fam13a [Homalodisca vitripennis]